MGILLQRARHREKLLSATNVCTISVDISLLPPLVL